jgi:two-component system sensor histidine kinase HydH
VSLDQSRPLSPASVRRDASVTLERRLIGLSAVRLSVLTLFLALIALVYLRGVTGGVSSTVAFSTVVAGYAFAAVYAALLRRPRLHTAIAFTQVVTDQLLWSSIVYLTGGAASGAVSLYGLTSVAAAIALGARGAVVGFCSGAATYVAVTALLVSGLLPPPPDQDVGAFSLTWATAAYPLVANLSALLVVAAMCGYLAERLSTAGGDLARAEERAVNAERLAGLGRLAAGLAHEIRNPLGGISGSIELLRSSPQLTEEDRALCDIVFREASRLNDLVEDMLDLARPQPPNLAWVDLAETSKDVVALAAKSGRGEDVKVEFRGPSSLRVQADAAKLRQLLWNLIRNAVQASGAGTLVLVEIERAKSQDAIIRVIDQGPGIPPEAADKIFDAFYTTRSHGTGVGLAVVKGIVDAHGWRVSVESGALGGTVFSVCLPPGTEHEVAAPGEEEGPIAVSEHV